MQLSKKSAVLLTTYLLAGILILAGFALQSRQEAMLLRRETDAGYQRAFSTLVTNVTEMDAALQKGLYATSPSMVSSVCTDAFGKAMAAQAALGELPFAAYCLEQTSGFISRVGDYTYLLARNSAAGQTATEEQQANLKALSDAASLLADNLTQLQADLNAGFLTLSQLEAVDSSVSSLGESFQQIESEFPEIPSLVYDGPFSHHLEQVEPKLLEKKTSIEEDHARKAAAAFSGVNENSLSLSGKSEGDLPCYYFNAPAEDGELSVCVSVQGGVVVSMFNSRQVDHPGIAAEEMLERAGAFLRDRGYTDMRESYWVIEENVGVINYAWVQDDILCYPDLVKVHVAMDDGSIVGFEALGYVTCHTERDMPEVQVSREAARSCVPASLRILSSQLVLIPSAGQYELLCHEFKCENEEGRHYILYVNAVTGQQEKILILLESENGTLAL